MSKWVVIPDTQCRPGAPTDHLRWAGEYIAEKKPDVIVHLGDHWDFPSLSAWDKKGSKSTEGLRYMDDIDAGNEGLRLIDGPINERIATYKRGKRKRWRPRKVLLRGNHEDRLRRVVEDDPRLEGALCESHLESPGWEVHPFLNVVNIDGVRVSHYFYQPLTGRPYGGQSMDTLLKTVGHSFTMGHRQTLLMGRREAGDRVHRGLIAGSYYLHDETFKGPQGNSHWRGLVVKHEVENGNYDMMEVSIQYLCRRYEGVDLPTFLEKKYPDLPLTLKNGSR
jgi:hypothetical protein